MATYNKITVICVPKYESIKILVILWVFSPDFAAVRCVKSLFPCFLFALFTILLQFLCSPITFSLYSGGRATGFKIWTWMCPSSNRDKVLESNNSISQQRCSGVWFCSFWWVSSTKAQSHYTVPLQVKTYDNYSLPRVDWRRGGRWFAVATPEEKTAKRSLKKRKLPVSCSRANKTKSKLVWDDRKATIAQITKICKIPCRTHNITNCKQMIYSDKVHTVFIQPLFMQYEYVCNFCRMRTGKWSNNLHRLTNIIQ